MEHPQAARRLSDSAFVHAHYLEDPTTAKQLQDRALSFLERNEFVDKGCEAETVVNVGEELMGLGDVDRALGMFQRSFFLQFKQRGLALARADLAKLYSPSYHLLSRTLHQVARLCYHSGNFDQAHHLAEQALNIHFKL